MILNSLIVLMVVVIMEGFAWLIHKYIMHGFMWHWHESHHTPRKGIFEKNDLFSLFFGSISAISIILGDLKNQEWLFWVGIGVAVYGVFYFLFHDVLVHQRIRFRFKTQNRYLKRIIQAHHTHHKVHAKKGAEAFGFLYAPKKYENLNK